MSAARHFCTWVEDNPTYDRDLRAPIALLADLLCHGAQLPTVRVDGPDHEDPAEAPRRTVIFGGQQYYWSHHDPFEGLDTATPPEPGLADLTDDIGDIYVDLMRGFVHWNVDTQASRVHALWCWKFDFDHHWGRHAASALNALVCALPP